jgi:hypothetical protein
MSVDVLFSFTGKEKRTKKETSRLAPDSLNRQCQGPATAIRTSRCRN